MIDTLPQGPLRPKSPHSRTNSQKVFKPASGQEAGDLLQWKQREGGPRSSSVATFAKGFAAKEKGGMFGYVRPYRPELTLRQDALYRAH